MRRFKKKKTAEQIQREARDLGWWYQCFELPSGVMTGTGQPPQYFPETRWNLIQSFVPKDLSGKKVLDVGGNAGYFSVQMMKRGAKSCTIIEPFAEFSAQARYVADLYGYDIRVVTEDVHTYCLTTEDRFDHVLFLGLFYHLKYPGLVLDRLAEMTRERMYFQCFVVGDGQARYEDREDYAPSKDDEILRDPAFPRMAFIEKLYNGDPTNWWIPNATALEPLLRSAGLKVVGRPEQEILIAEPDRPFGKVLYRKLVFPKYGKPNGSLCPGTQKVDPALWEKLLNQR